MTQIFYIYAYINKNNGKRYIGKTNNISRRKSKHRRKAFIEKSNLPFYNALRKYTEEGFDFVILDRVADESAAFKMEINYISFFESNNSEFGYNLTSGGEGSSGTKHNDNQKHNNKLQFGANNGNSKINDNIAISIYNEYMDGAPLSDLSLKYNISQITLERLLSGKSWKHLNLDIDKLKSRKRSHYGANMFNAKLSYASAKEICNLYLSKDDVSLEYLSKLYGVSISSINNVLRGKTFKQNIEYDLISDKIKKIKIKTAINNSPFKRGHHE